MQECVAFMCETFLSKDPQIEAVREDFWAKHPDLVERVWVLAKEHVAPD
jgi:hypothetical protein